MWRALSLRPPCPPAAPRMSMQLFVALGDPFLLRILGYPTSLETSGWTYLAGFVPAEEEMSFLLATGAHGPAPVWLY